MLLALLDRVRLAHRTYQIHMLVHRTTSSHIIFENLFHHEEDVVILIAFTFSLESFLHTCSFHSFIAQFLFLKKSRVFTFENAQEERDLFAILVPHFDRQQLFLDSLHTELNLFVNLSR